MPAYARPTRLEDALKIVALGGFSVLAGGTDFYPARVGKPLPDDVLDLSALPELRGIAEKPGHWRFGATTSWSSIIEASLPPVFDCLKLAAREVGGRQIQNSGTIAGNLCNASPAADGVPALLALNANVELSSSAAVRVVPLENFIVGPRKTVLGSNEIVSAILVPKPAHPATSAFLKLGARKYLVISIAMAACAIEVEKGIVRAARVAVGACSPVAKRLNALESVLTGKALAEGIFRHVKPEHLDPLSPLDDVRGSAQYRRDAVLVLLRRMLGSLK